MYKTEQENFWSGKFGDEYVGRNSEQTMLGSNTALFSTVLSRTGGGKTCNWHKSACDKNADSLCRMFSD